MARSLQRQPQPDPGLEQGMIRRMRRLISPFNRALGMQPAAHALPPEKQPKVGLAVVRESFNMATG